MAQSPRSPGNAPSRRPGPPGTPAVPPPPLGRAIRRRGRRRPHRGAGRRRRGPIGGPPHQDAVAGGDGPGRDYGRAPRCVALRGHSRRSLRRIRPARGNGGNGPVNAQSRRGPAASSGTASGRRLAVRRRHGPAAQHLLPSVVARSDAGHAAAGRGIAASAGRAARPRRLPVGGAALGGAAATGPRRRRGRGIAAPADPRTGQGVRRIPAPLLPGVGSRPRQDAARRTPRLAAPVRAGRGRDARRAGDGNR